MHLTTDTRQNLLAQASAQLFNPTYEQCSDLYPSETNFYEEHAYFFTFTFHQYKVSLSDRLGFSTGPCFYQDLSDQRSGSFVSLKAKSVSELRSIAKALSVPDFETLPKLDLIFSIQEKRGIKHEAILQRPLTAIRPKPHPLEVMRYFHFNIARACVGANLSNKLRYQPTMLAYVDFEGTRHGVVIDPLRSSWKHVHAILLLRPNHTERFNSFITPMQEHFDYLKRKRDIACLNRIEKHQRLTVEQQSHRLSLHQSTRKRSTLRLSGDLAALRDMKFERYNANNPLSRLMGYSSKGADKIAVQYIQRDNRTVEAEWSGANDLYAVFPEQLQLTSASRSADPTANKHYAISL